MQLRNKVFFTIFCVTILTAFISGGWLFFKDRSSFILTQDTFLEPLTTPWTGTNVWGIAAAEDVYNCGGRPASHQQTVDNTFANLKTAGASVVRFFAFQSYAIDENGQRNWTALDRTFASAQSHGMYLIPVLGNNWVDCDYWPLSLYPSGGQRKDTTRWYATGYQSLYDGYLTDYRQWVTDITARYSKHPALLAWELINEPRENTEVMTNFINDIIPLIQANDPVTPVSLGCICHGEPGFAASDYILQHSLSGVGFATVHDYPSDSTDPNNPFPWYVSNAINNAASIGIPFFVGEMGRNGVFDQAKIDMYKAKMQAAFDAGAVGYLLWSYNDDQPIDSAGYSFGANSPMMIIFSLF